MVVVVVMLMTVTFVFVDPSMQQGHWHKSKGLLEETLRVSTVQIFIGLLTHHFEESVHMLLNVCTTSFRSSSSSG